ncbi:hypothetical protein L226DRAFT_465921 [Lentinus tigrinus ALCF2SS1-7]|uniref:uncharacterized protein n=1 Tax=Lentinus tigrinus ALCF2SS1-7 TaxID=1328758 RepID=UPI001165D9C1|nr:hypothetical protein L226DRAFT_465921 [Lentinus tigrinus ALCF2SS1-7]
MHKNNKAQRKDWVGNCSWADAIIPIEVKIDLSRSAFYFDDDPKKFMRTDTDEGREALGQIAEYMAQIFGHQHRKHLHAVYVYKNRARLLYFDRQGGVVSEPFDYGTREHLTLHTFFWRIAHMSREELGFDPTVVLASEDEKNKMRDFAASAPTEYLKRQIYHALSLDPDDPRKSISSQWPAYKLTMCGRRYIIGRPTFASPALYGRCTRGYLAFDLDVDGDGNGAVRFLKDSWRPDLERDSWQLDLDRVRPEHKAYERLHSQKVPHIATYLAHEDVPASNGSWQRTTVNSFFDPPRPSRGHYRLLIKEVCRSLTDFLDFGELTALMCYAIYAHKQAWEKAGVLHRDVSVGNILILENGRGSNRKRTAILCDWDLCKYKEEMVINLKARTPDRTGTWYFRSALSLMFPCRPYRLADDIESFVHVYHYCVLRFHLTDQTPDLANFVETVYDTVVVRPADGAHVGSVRKFNMMQSATPHIVPIKNPTLVAFLTDIAKLCSEHYATIDRTQLALEYDPQTPDVDDSEPVMEALPEQATGLDQCVDDDIDEIEEVEEEAQESPEPQPRSVEPKPQPTLDNYKHLRTLFMRYARGKPHKKGGRQVRWPTYQTKCQDLFKGMRVAPRKDNGFETRSQSQDLPQQDQREKGRPGKKRKGNDGSALPDVQETVEEGTGV